MDSYRRTVNKLAFFVWIAMISACQSQPEQREPLFVCTTGYVADLVRNLLSDQVRIHVLMGPGVDPHLYKISLRDVEWLEEADVIVGNGLHLEGKMSEKIEGLKQRKTVWDLGSLLSKQDLIYLDSLGSPDPHIWFDAHLWVKCTKGMDRLLAQHNHFSAYRDTLKRNKYIENCLYLDQWATEKMKAIPTPKRVLITPHDAFSYFSRRYQIEVRSLQGISTTSEYGIYEVSQLSKFIIDRQIPTLFVESSISSQSIEAIIDDCRRKGHAIQLGQTLYSDALGSKSKHMDTYSAVFRHNVSAIYHGLQTSKDE